MMLCTLVWFLAVVYAEYPSLNVYKDWLVEGREMVLGDLLVARNVLFGGTNTPYIYVTENFSNLGRTIFTSNHRLEPNSHVEYSFDGRFSNEGWFMVRHDNPVMPVSVHISGRSLGHECLINHAVMVFLIHGPAKPDMHAIITVPRYFDNRGPIMVLGTLLSKARLELRQAQFLEVHDGESKSHFGNNGALYVKNGEIHQNVNVTESGGCIIIDEGGSFISDGAYVLKDQWFFFVPNAAATLELKLSHVKREFVFFVLSFGPGSRIVVGGGAKKMIFLSDRTVLLYTANMGQEPEKRVIVRFLRPMKQAKFLFENNVLTYDGADHIPQTDVCLSVSKRLQALAAANELWG